MDSFAEDLVTHLRLERVRRYEVYGPPQKMLQLCFEVEKGEEADGLAELNKDVNIAAGPHPVTRHRAE